MSPREENSALKAEADRLMARAGLAELLAGYAQWFAGGSYRYDLMCWRDLDLYVLDPEHALKRCFDVAFEITRRLGAIKSRFTNSLGKEPDGFYWGILLGDERSGAWKIDLWFLSAADYDRHAAYAERMRQIPTDADRAIIHAIKRAHWASPAYRQTITSHMIYDAVLNHGVRTEGEFQQFLARP